MMIAKHSVFMRSAFALVLLAALAGAPSRQLRTSVEYTVSWSVATQHLPDTGN